MRGLLFFLLIYSYFIVSLCSVPAVDPVAEVPLRTRCVDGGSGIAAAPGWGHQRGTDKFCPPPLTAQTNRPVCAGAFTGISSEFFSRLIPCQIASCRQKDVTRGRRREAACPAWWLRGLGTWVPVVAAPGASCSIPAPCALRGPAAHPDPSARTRASPDQSSGAQRGAGRAPAEDEQSPGCLGDTGSWDTAGRNIGVP